jgi:DNA-binding response OmpR family regulator
MSSVLICEDEVPLRRIIALNLAHRGFSVAEADSVAAAREALAAWNTAFDVILLDVNLPDQTGWDLLRYLAGKAKRPRVIIITAVRPPQALVDEFQPDAVLVKPFPIQTLFRLIERVLANEPASEELGETGEGNDASLQQEESQGTLHTGS